MLKVIAVSRIFSAWLQIRLTAKIASQQNGLPSNGGIKSLHGIKLYRNWRRASTSEIRNAKHNNEFRTTTKLTGCDRARRTDHIAVSITYITNDHTKYPLDVTVIDHRRDGHSIQ